MKRWATRAFRWLAWSILPAALAWWWLGRMMVPKPAWRVEPNDTLTAAAWSPDGTYLDIVQTTADGRAELQRRDAATGAVKSVLNLPLRPYTRNGDRIRPVPLPDGRWGIYVADPLIDDGRAFEFRCVDLAGGPAEVVRLDDRVRYLDTSTERQSNIIGVEDIPSWSFNDVRVQYAQAMAQKTPAKRPVMEKTREYYSPATGLKLRLGANERLQDYVSETRLVAVERRIPQESLAIERDGRLLWSLGKTSNYPRFSPNGRWLRLYLDDEKKTPPWTAYERVVRLVRSENGQAVVEFRHVRAAEFLPDSTLLVVQDSYERPIPDTLRCRRFDPETAKELGAYDVRSPFRVNGNYGVAIHPLGATAVILQVQPGKVALLPAPALAFLQKWAPPLAGPFAPREWGGHLLDLQTGSVANLPGFAYTASPDGRSYVALEERAGKYFHEIYRLPLRPNAWLRATLAVAIGMLVGMVLMALVWAGRWVFARRRTVPVPLPPQ